MEGYLSFLGLPLVHVRTLAMLNGVSFDFLVGVKGGALSHCPMLAMWVAHKDFVFTKMDSSLSCGECLYDSQRFFGLGAKQRS